MIEAHSRKGRMSTQKMYVIGVAGGSGSGKSTVVKNILQLAGPENTLLLQHDNYYRRQDHLPLEERPKTNYDHPDSLETSLLVEHIRALREGHAIEMPLYDFVHHTRSNTTTTVSPQPVILIDGILIFNDPQLRELCDLRIFVDTDADVRLARRLERDVAERGRTYEFGIHQYLTFTRPMHLQFVEPSKRFADIIIPEGGFNTQALSVVSAFIKQKLSNVVQ